MGPFLAHFAYFLAACAVVAVVQALYRVDRPAAALHETLRSFLYIAGGIGIFSILVFLLDGCFVR